MKKEPLGAGVSAGLLLWLEAGSVKTVDEIKREIEDSSEEDSTPAEVYRQYCMILLDEIERLKNKKCVHDLAREFSASVGQDSKSDNE